MFLIAAFCFTIFVAVNNNVCTEKSVKTIVTTAKALKAKATNSAINLVIVEPTTISPISVRSTTSSAIKSRLLRVAVASNFYPTLKSLQASFENNCSCKNRYYFWFKWAAICSNHFRVTGRHIFVGRY